MSSSVTLSPDQGRILMEINQQFASGKNVLTLSAMMASMPQIDIQAMRSALTALHWFGYIRLADPDALLMQVTGVTRAAQHWLDGGIGSGPSRRSIEA